MAWPPEDVVPLPEGKRVELRRPRPRPYPRQTRRDEEAALQESLTAPVSLDDALDSGEELAFVREGLGSYHREPVLKGLLRKWLQQRSEVLAFSQAPAAQGGSGAVLVLLRG